MENETEVPRQKDALSLFGAVLLMINATAGAGVLNFPQSYEFGGGYFIPILLQLICVLLTLWGLLTITLLGLKTNAETLENLLYKCDGKNFSIAFSVIIVCYGLASCTTYLIIIGDQLDRVFYSLISPTFCKTWYLRREFTIAALSSIIILPNIYSKRIDFLIYASNVGVIGVLYAIGMIILLYFIGGYEPGKIGGGPKNWNEVTYLIPTFCFAFHCHAQSLPILSCLREKSVKNVVIACSLNYTVCFFMYAGAGICGYATFGDKVMSNIILNYDAGSPIVVVGLILLCIKICCSYPIVLYVGRAAFLSFCYIVLKYENLQDNIKLRIVVATVFHLISLLLAIAVPNIGLIIGFMGMFVVMFIFLVPGVSQVYASEKLTDPKWVNINKILGIILSAFGISLSLFVFIQSIKRVVYASQEGFEKLCKS